VGGGWGGRGGATGGTGRAPARVRCISRDAGRSINNPCRGEACLISRKSWRG